MSERDSHQTVSVFQYHSLKLQGTLLVASENGIGKRSPFGDYRAQTRGGKGIITMKCTDKTGLVVGAATVYPDDELMLMTSDGQSIRIRCNDVREAGRNTQGVKLVTLKAGSALKDIARVVPDDEAIEDADADAESVDEIEGEDTAVENTDGKTSEE